MTVRRGKRVPTDPAEVAARVPAAALAVFPPEDYRAYFAALTEEVEEITDQHSHGLTLRVAEELEIGPASWFRRKLRSLGTTS